MSLADASAGTDVRSRIPFRLDALRGGDGAALVRAGAVFGLRVTSAALLLLTQILLARWMGSHEFGVYVFAWTVVVLVGDLAPLGFPFVAQRVIPAARHAGEADVLRGFLLSSRLTALALASFAALVLLAVTRLSGAYLGGIDPVVMSIAALALPAYGVMNVVDGIARSFDRPNLALVPALIGRPVILIALVGAAHMAGVTADAALAVTVAALSTWTLLAVQMLLLRRHLAREVGPGPRAFRYREWLAISAQIFGTLCCVTLFTYTDMLVLNAFTTPDQLAVYYAAAKTIAIGTFVTFAVASVVGHKFVEHHVAGDRDGLERLLRLSVRGTFWVSLGLMAAILVLGRFILGLFGPEFVGGYGLMFIMAAGLLLRASVGPAERLLNVMGEQRAAMGVYASAFAVNLALCLALVPFFGLAGAAVAVAAASAAEALLLWRAARTRLGLHAFAFGRGGKGAA